MKQKDELKQLKGMDSKALAKELAASQKKLVTLNFNAKLRKLKNVKEISAERKRIARIWTILAENAFEEAMKEEVKDAK